VRLGTTVDDAIGEAFDKTAKLLGLGLSGRTAGREGGASGNKSRFGFARPMLGKPNADFSLSGLKTALRIEAEKSRRSAMPTCATCAHRPAGGRHVGKPVGSSDSAGLKSGVGLTTSTTGLLERCAQVRARRPSLIGAIFSASMRQRGLEPGERKVRVRLSSIGRGKANRLLLP